METVESKTAITPVVGVKSDPPKVGDVNTAPTTTAEQDRSTAGQVAINLMWEKTQRIIALSVTGTACFCAVYQSLFAKNDKESGNQFLFGVANLVIGFYFGRTNHQRTGGVLTGDTGR